MITWLHDFDLSPHDNVQKDKLIFDATCELASPMVVRVHTFRDYCATTGYLTRLRGETKEKFKRSAVPLLQRITGGGVALHGDDLCFSFFFNGGPALNLLYRSCVMEIRRIVTVILKRSGGIPVKSGNISRFKKRESEFCLGAADEGDIFLGGEKIAGFAGRVRKNRFLIHLQLITPGWDRDMIRSVAGIQLNVPGEFSSLKKFVFSEAFLINMKEEVEYAFSSRMGYCSTISKCLTV